MLIPEADFDTCYSQFWYNFPLSEKYALFVYYNQTNADPTVYSNDFKNLKLQNAVIAVRVRE